MSEWNLQSLMNCDQVELDLGMGFQEFIPDMFQEVRTAPEMSVDLLSYPISNGSINSISRSNALQPEMCDMLNYQQQQQYHEHDWGALNAPCNITNSAQFGETAFSNTPAGYEEPRFYQTNFVNGRKRRTVGQRCLDYPDLENSSSDGDQQIGGKPKRRRVQNAKQRKEANVRERKRMFLLNDAFDSLKTKVPTFAYEKRLSRMETLKLAMSYISFMTQILDGKKSDEIPLRDNGSNSFSLADLGQLSSSYVSDGTDSSESGSTSS